MCFFLPDRNDPHRYHPRISAQNDLAYSALSGEEKAAFDRLYYDYYYCRHNEFWREEAMKKLPRLTQSTRMLVCGEDLGMIPGCVPSVMDELRIFVVGGATYAQNCGAGIWTPGVVSLPLGLHYFYTRYVHPQRLVGGIPGSDRTLL